MGRSWFVLLVPGLPDAMAGIIGPQGCGRYLIRKLR